MEQFEQLLTCCVCLDRYRNPKLLPCQHSFCMEPCMDGLVDYVRRQVKCPECRAEHRIPYQGVQGFPTNVTLTRFLELHIEITGELPDPTSGQTMERCNVCSEKSYCTLCGHCDKKICPECKGAHMDILRREILRINNQIRRGIHRLQDAAAVVEKNTLSLQTNCLSVSEEVDEIYRRLIKGLKDRTDFMRSEVDRYLGTELRNLSTLKDNLELEIANIQSNCDLADKHMTENVEWDDNELMDTKEIFLKTVDFIRNFEYEPSNYDRRIRFTMSMDPNQLVMHVATYGELIMAQGHGGFGGTVGGSSSTSSLLQPPGGPGLMRSKSDHRLASQFRQQEENQQDLEPPLGGRKFGERPARHAAADKQDVSSRYGRTTGGGTDYGEYDYENDSNRPTRSRFRSRFVRNAAPDNDSDTEQNSRSVRFTEQQQKDRERVLDTEDAARGPLSGIFRLTDSPRVMKRLQECEKGKKKEKEPVVPVQQPPQPKVQITKRPTVAPPAAQRQVSEDDEIGKIKRLNKGAATSADTTDQRPVVERVAALKRTPDDSDDSPSPAPSSPTRLKTPVTEAASSDAEESDESVSSLQQTQRITAASKSAAAPRRPSAVVEATTAHKKASRSTSSDSSTSSESSTASSSAVRNTGAAFTTEEVKQKILARGSIDNTNENTPRSRVSSTGSNTATTERREPAAPTKAPFQSRFLGGGIRPTSTPAPVEVPAEEDDTESSSEEETESSEESDEEPKKPVVPLPDMSKTDIGPLLARSSQARETRETAESRRSKDPTPENNVTTSSRSQYGTNTNAYKSPYSTEDTTPKYRTRPAPAPEEEPPSRYGSGGSSYSSRFLNKSRSTAQVPDEDDAVSIDDESKYPSGGRSRYLALKERRNRLARSRSSHTMGDEEDIDEPVSPTTASPSAYIASRYGTSLNTPTSDLSRSRSSHALKSRESSPERPTPGSDKDGAALSSWARYLKSKYGNRGAKDTKENSSASNIQAPASSTSASRRLSLGLPLRAANEHGSSDDDQKNVLGSPISPTAATAAAGMAAAAAGTSPRSQYLQKRRQLFNVGSRGGEPGSFTWPRGIAVGPDNTIVVADSSNHRVQVFDSQGVFVKEFGTYGNGEGEFDCLAGVAVNRIGQYIIADRYNHRIQVLDPSGRFLRAFGTQGTADGRFNYPWGITTDALGFIYVCDKENHRVQVFQSDGTFVGKFGSMGKAPGQLEHPHYIAVSNTNRVIVSDSNNHRVQIFDVNGRVLTAFGTEGSDDGQFKFPRGVAVDDQGYIIVADSGNNRIQIFHPDGSFLRAFGCWGSGDAEFKGLEGIAVMSNGNILVCDRENHRIQVF